MPETMVLCGGEAAPHRHRGNLVELDVAKDAAQHKKIDFQSDQVCAGLLDDVPDIVADALEIAVYVYSADRLVRRATSIESSAIGSEWQRTLRFRIPVRRPDVWLRPDVNSLLIDTLSFLAGDVFEFEFTTTKHAMPLAPSLGFNDPKAQSFRPDHVMLFSGGLDSFAGVVRDVVGTGRSAMLVAHQSANAIISHQDSLAKTVADRTGPKRIHYAPVRIRRGMRNPIEHSQRLRSFLFAALGLAYSRMFGLNTVRFYENGITSFNLPVAEHVLGTRASRTTHPRVLASYSKLFSLLLDTEVHFENPFLWMTKTDIVKTIQAGGCADLITETISCAAVRNYSMKRLQCGTCSQCVERRIAMVAAGCEETDVAYERDMFLGPIENARELTMIAGHLARARNLARALPGRFVANHGQVLRAILGVDASPDTAFDQIYELHQRYGREFEEAVNLRFQRSANIDDIRVVHPHSLLGILMPSTEPAVARRDPAELGSIVSEAPAARPRSCIIVLALDEQRQQVLFDKEIALKKSDYILLSTLVRSREEAERQKSSAANAGYIKTKKLIAELGDTEEGLRQRVYRLRRKISKRYEELTGYILDEMDLIQNKQWRGYRLNPAVVVVEAHQLRRQPETSRNLSPSVTETSYQH